jgi:hypothetical protein
MNPEDILSEAEMAKERTPQELAIWVEERHSLFRTSKESRKYCREGRGLAKKFIEEVIPLSIFASRCYAGRSDIKCIPNLGNENYDAIIYDYSFTPPSELKVEITYAVDGYDQALRKEVLHRDGGVFITGEINKDTSTKHKDRKIEVVPSAIKSEGGLENLLLLIKKAAEGKSNKPYGSQHILLIVFSNLLSLLLKGEDTYPENSSYIESFRSLLYRDIATLPLDFQRVCVFDYSSSIFLQVPIEKYNLG